MSADYTVIDGVFECRKDAAILDISGDLRVKAIRNFPKLRILAACESGLEVVENLPSLRRIEFRKAPLREVRDLPRLVYLVAGESGLEVVEDLPLLKSLHAENTPLREVRGLPSLERLFADGSELVTVNGCPKLRRVRAEGSKLVEIYGMAGDGCPILSVRGTPLAARLPRSIYRYGEAFCKDREELLQERALQEKWAAKDARHKA